jgi:hypothetical protein
MKFPGFPSLKGCVLLVAVMAAFITGTKGQSVITELNRQLYYEGKAYPVHSSLKPYLEKDWKNFTDIVPARQRSKAANSLFYTDFLRYDNKSGINFSINPLLNLEGGKETGDPLYADSLFYTNTRGLKIEGNIGEKFTFYTSFYENQSRYLPYIDAYVRETRASVGMGRTKTFKITGHDYAMASGMLVYRPVQPVEIWFGHGKNFIGAGYRSLLLSDHAANYPHLKVNLKLLNDKLRYTFVFASLMSSERLKQYSTGEPALYRKGANFNYLSYAPSGKLEIGLFESVIWKRFENGRIQSPDILQFNPVILGGTLSQGLDGTNNASLGLNVVWKPMITTSVYGQLLLDGKSRNGFQVGVLKRDLLVKGLYFQAEVNKVAGNTYIAADSLSNYTHLWQALAHPMGAGFTEVTGVLNYRYGRIVAEIQGAMAKFDHTYGGKGQNLVYSASAVATAGSTHYLFIKPSVALVVNPATNMQLKAGALLRKLDNGASRANTSYVFVALSTNLNNLYFDF